MKANCMMKSSGPFGYGGSKLQAIILHDLRIGHQSEADIGGTSDKR
jgi:hypothetical protein